MRKALTTLVGAVVLLSPGTALAQEQPSQGVHSTGRDDAGTGGGPHCHFLLSAGDQEAFGTIRVYPSHTAHLATGIGEVFGAITDPIECPVPE